LKREVGDPEITADETINFFTGKTTETEFYPLVAFFRNGKVKRKPTPVLI
jgi:hypothetical protein